MIKVGSLVETMPGVQRIYPGANDKPKMSSLITYGGERLCVLVAHPGDNNLPLSLVKVLHQSGVTGWIRRAYIREI